jgi:hypothetical protein
VRAEIIRRSSSATRAIIPTVSRFFSRPRRKCASRDSRSSLAMTSVAPVQAAVGQGLEQGRTVVPLAALDLGELSGRGPASPADAVEHGGPLSLQAQPGAALTVGRESIQTTQADARRRRLLPGTVANRWTCCDRPLGPPGSEDSGCAFFPGERTDRHVPLHGGDRGAKQTRYAKSETFSN